MLGKIFPKDYISASTCTGYLHLFMPMYSTRYYFIILSPDAANILRLIFNLSIYLFLDVSHPSCVLFLLFTEKSCTETNFQIKNVKIPPQNLEVLLSPLLPIQSSVAKASSHLHFSSCLLVYYNQHIPKS